MYFAASDPFNVPANSLDGSSALYQQFIKTHAGSANLMSDADWGVPVYHAALTDPWVTIKSSVYDAGATFSLHLPANAKPSGGEGKLVVLSPVTGGMQTETDLFGFTRDSAGNPHAEGLWQARCDLGAPSTTGFSQGVLGHVCGSGIMQLAGMVLASELVAGFIAHALAFTIPETLSRNMPNAFRPPANQTDGTHSPGIPMGAHIQLDPTYSVTHLSPWAQVFARALQTYGAYLNDTGGSLGFYGESPYTGAYPPGFVATDIRAVDWSRVWVLSR